MTVRRWTEQRAGAKGRGSHTASLLIASAFLACTATPVANPPTSAANPENQGIAPREDSRSTARRESLRAQTDSPLISAQFEGMFRVEDGSRRQGPLQRGAVMYTGDWFWVNIHVIRDAHVYVLYLEPDGTPRLLFPLALERDESWPAGSSLRIPPLPEMFTLDAEVGTEHVIVIASAAPVGTSDPDLRRLLEHAERQPTAAQQAPGQRSDASAPVTDTAKASARESATLPSPPSDGYLSRIADRGVLRVNPSAGIDAREAPDGVAVIHFEFEHR